MAIYLPASAEEQDLALDELTPREIVAELDKHVVGQKAAKRAVAIALRNRQRRQKLPPDLADDIMPKNIIMIGPTGVGKTEIARRLAKLTNSPFLKVEASKFTEVGYVGRDVESMIRDLVEIAIDMVREERLEEVEDRAEMNAEERLLDILLPPAPPTPPAPDGPPPARRQRQPSALPRKTSPAVPRRQTRRPHGRARRARSRHAPVRHHLQPEPRRHGDEPQGHAAQHLRGRHQEAQNEVSPMPSTTSCRKKKAASSTWIRSTASPSSASNPAASSSSTRSTRSPAAKARHGPDVSREGVQRDILPIVEGTTVNTRYGMVRTDHILFIAAGAFHVSKPSDLIPELQGRFPLRVELQSLTVEDFLRILTEPKSSLTKQYTALLETEGVRLEFAPEALREMAEFAFTRQRSD